MTLDNRELERASLMLFHEPMIHLREKRLRCNVTVSQDDLDGVYALITWLDGYVANGSTAVPGHYELLMLYRSLRNADNAQQKSGRPQSKE